MIIAVNTRGLPEDFPREPNNFIWETFKLIAANNPEHTFIFIFDRPCNQHLIFPANIKSVVTGPVASNPLLWKFWYDVKVPAVLKKYKADVFVSCHNICSLFTKVPQCFLVQDLGFLHHPSFIKKSHLNFYKKYMAKFLGKAKSIATLSGFVKQDIITHYKIEPSKIDVIFSGANNIFQPISDGEKKVTKDKYTGGREYFLYSGEIHPQKNLLNLLKAFSVFKKRQQTNMKMVLAGKLAKNYSLFKEDLKSYKYRNDVVLTSEVEERELVKITGAAYGFIYPSLYEGSAVPVLQALQCGIPVITTPHSSMQEIAKDAALYADANSHTAIADKMMLLYKNENMRKDLIEKGKEITNKYSWKNSAQLLWQSILKAGR